MNSIKLVDRNKCAMCSSGESTIYIPFPDIPVVQCNRCGFIYSAKVLSEQDTYSYYRNNFGSHRHLQGQIVNALINMRVIEKLVDIADISSFLDVGTGYGFLLDTLKRLFKVEIAGAELSHQEAEYAVKKLGLNVINAPLVESGLKTNHYDLVTAFEVIEHILEPLDFIHAMTQYVKPGGYLLIMTDNFTSRMAKSLGPGFPKWIPHTHVSHFSPETLRTAIEASGNLKIVKSVSYTPWEIHLRDGYYKIRGIKKTPSEAFNLSETLKNEMAGKYNLFEIRKLINKTWVQLTLSESMDGDLMYFLAKRIN